MKPVFGGRAMGVRGGGARAAKCECVDRESSDMKLASLEGGDRRARVGHGEPLLPGSRDELAAIEEEVLGTLLIGAQQGARFEDQYASSGGQLYELMDGPRPIRADLRPLLAPSCAARGLPPSCAAIRMTSAQRSSPRSSAFMSKPRGGRFDGAFDIVEEVAWVGYANKRCSRLSNHLEGRPPAAKPAAESDVTLETQDTNANAFVDRVRRMVSSPGIGRVFQQRLPIGVARAPGVSTSWAASPIIRVRSSSSSDPRSGAGRGRTCTGAGRAFGSLDDDEAPCCAT